MENRMIPTGKHWWSLTTNKIVETGEIVTILDLQEGRPLIEFEDGRIMWWWIRYLRLI